jgi:DNA repair exonuclease SbcCD ATPase subunit
MYRLIRFEIENSIGLYNGLNKKKVELDLRDYRDKSVFIFLGGNAQGKSTLLSILHPFSGTTDKRDRFIREDKEGYKQLIYENQEDTDVSVRIRHVYTPNKNGGHGTRSFIHKIIDGKELDLNPNGNVSSFIMAVEQEFGITEDFMRLSAQNEDMVSLVNMTGSNRKDHIYNFIPKADDTTIYQRTVARKYRDVKIFLSSIVDKLGKMDDEVSIKEKLKEIEERTNELVDRRDKYNGKINKYVAELNTLDPDDQLMDRYRRIRSELRELNDKQEKLQNKVSRLSGETSHDVTTVNGVDKALTSIMIDKLQLREKLIEVRSSLSSRRQIKSNLYDSIEEKESLVRQLSGTKSKADLVELMESYEKKVEKYDKRSKNLNTALTADDLIRGIDILDHLRQFMYDIHNNTESSKIIEDASISAFSNKFENRYVETSKSLEAIKEKREKLTTNIVSLSSYEHLKDTMDRRPKDCVIDSCSFLQDYHKWIIIDGKIKEFEEQLNDLNDSYEKLFNEMERLSETQKIKTKVESLLTFYKSNLSLLSKLPFNDKYSTQDKLIARLIDRDMLSGAEDNFYELIEILQDKKEYDDIRNVKIPLLSSELKNLKDNDGVVESVQAEIKKLEKKHSVEVEEIEKETEVLEKLEKQISSIEYEEEMLTETRDRLFKLEQNKDEIIKLSNDFDAIKQTTEKIEELRIKMDERKQQLKAVDARLKPLTQERDHYKYQEIKINEYKMEKEILEENLQILTLIRDALSTNKGIPVSILNMYVDEIRKNANMLLSDTFDGSLYLERFEINEKEFTIPYQHNGDRGPDISKASSSERSFISTCLSMAIMEQIIASYGILNLDEIDAGFSEQNKAIYCAILMKQIKRVGINQVFFATHSREYYEPYDVCYILFPGHTLKEAGKDVIKLY